MSYIQEGGGGGGSGTVTSVGETVNGGASSGIFTVSGSPVIAAGTLDIATAGNSGGVPYFSSGTIISSSGALTNNSPVMGGGAGAAPKTATFLTTDGAAVLTVGVAAGGNGALALSGNTSGTATFTAPAIAGTTTNPVTASNVILGPNGAVAAPTFAVRAANNGLWSSAAGTVDLSAGGVNVFRVNATNTIFLAGNAGFFGGKGQHFVTQAAANDMAGTFTVSASTTGSVTFTTNYTSTPAIVLTPQTTGLTSWFLSAVSNSGFTVTVAPSGTYTFAYIVIGNPS